MRLRRHRSSSSLFQTANAPLQCHKLLLHKPLRHRPARVREVVRRRPSLPAIGPAPASFQCLAATTRTEHCSTHPVLGPPARARVLPAPAPAGSPAESTAFPSLLPDKPPLPASARPAPTRAAPANWTVPAASGAPRVAHPETAAYTAHPPVPTCLPPSVTGSAPVLPRSFVPAGSWGAPDRAVDGCSPSFRPAPLRSMQTPTASPFHRPFPASIPKHLDTLRRETRSVRATFRAVPPATVAATVRRWHIANFRDRWDVWREVRPSTGVGRRSSHARHCG